MIYKQGLYSTKAKRGRDLWKMLTSKDLALLGLLYQPWNLSPWFLTNRCRNRNCTVRTWVSTVNGVLSLCVPEIMAILPSSGLRDLNAE